MSIVNKMNLNINKVPLMSSLLAVSRSGRCAIISFFVFIIIVAHVSSSNAQCPTLRLNGDSLNFGRVLIGATLDSVFSVSDTVADTIKDTIINLDTQFQLNKSQSTFTVGSSPIFLQATFAPSSVGSFARTDEFKPSVFGHCPPFNVVFYGQGVEATPDSSTINILDNTTPFIGILDTGKSPVRSFYFKNASGSTAQVQSISLTDATVFTLTAKPSFPLQLAAGDSISVQITFKAADTTLHRSECIIVTSGLPLSEAIALQGVRLNVQSSVGHPSQSALFTIDINPNPSHGEVTVFVDGLRRGVVEVYDILGRIMSTSAIADTWKWNGVTNSGASAVSGVYIVRVSGTDESGRNVAASKRFVIER
jgi:hypothetical protein